MNLPDRICSQADQIGKMSSLGQQDCMDCNNMYPLTQYEELFHSTTPKWKLIVSAVFIAQTAHYWEELSFKLT